MKFYEILMRLYYHCMRIIVITTHHIHRRQTNQALYRALRIDIRLDYLRLFCVMILSQVEPERREGISDCLNDFVLLRRDIQF